MHSPSFVTANSPVNSVSTTLKLQEKSVKIGEILLIFLLEHPQLNVIIIHIKIKWIVFVNSPYFLL